MTEYINKEEILKSSIRTHHYDRERGNAHYIKSVESAVEYIENIPPTDVVNTQKTLTSAFQALDLVFG